MEEKNFKVCESIEEANRVLESDYSWSERMSAALSLPNKPMFVYHRRQRK